MWQPRLPARVWTVETSALHRFRLEREHSSGETRLSVDGMVIHFYRRAAVIRREYHTFCLTIAIFVVLRTVYVLTFGRAWTIEPFWAVLTLFDLFVFLVVRLLRKRTSLLRVVGR